MPRTNPAMWGHGPSPATTPLAQAAAQLELASPGSARSGSSAATSWATVGLPLDAALADSRTALERHRLHPDDPGFMAESIEKLGVAEAALAREIAVQQAQRGDGQLEQQLFSRLQKTERRRKALQRRAGVSDSPRASERAGSPEHRPRTPPGERTGGDGAGASAHDMSLSPWAASPDAGDTHSPPPLISPRELAASAEGAISPRSQLRWPLPRVHNRASNAEMYANSSGSRIPKLAGLIGTIATLEELEEYEAGAARENTRVEVSVEQSTDRLQVLSGLIAQVQEYEAIEASMKAELRRLELVGAAHLIARWRCVLCAFDAVVTRVCTNP